MKVSKQDSCSSPYRKSSSCSGSRVGWNKEIHASLHKIFISISNHRMNGNRNIRNWIRCGNICRSKGRISRAGILSNDLHFMFGVVISYVVKALKHFLLCCDTLTPHDHLPTWPNTELHCRWSHPALDMPETRPSPCQSVCVINTKI